jgi:hypothetical protein
LHDFFVVHAHNGQFYGKLIGGFVAVCLLLGMLHILPRQYRKWIVAFFTFLAGLYYALEFFWPAKGDPSENWLTPSQEFVSNATSVVGSFAVGVGVISVLHLHGRNILKQRQGWGNSIVLIVSFLAMLIFGLMAEYTPATRIFGNTTASDVFEFLFEGGFNNLGAAMFSLIAFFIASASYRAFRVRSLESSLLMIAALIVMLGSVSLGVAITQGLPDGDSFVSNFRMERIAQWLMQQINSPAQRGILFGLVTGGLAISLRLWLSLERGAYFDEEL